MAHNFHKQRITPAVEITSHIESHGQCCAIKRKDVKSKYMKILWGSNHVKHFSQKDQIYEKVELGPSN